jgi:hypothetical protein
MTVTWGTTMENRGSRCQLTPIDEGQNSPKRLSFAIRVLTDVATLAEKKKAAIYRK